MQQAYFKHSDTFSEFELAFINQFWIETIRLDIS